jgi:glycosyltransferase involved in cell wall biosynthesis
LGARLEASGYRNLRILSRGVDPALFKAGRRDEAPRAAWGAGPLLTSLQKQQPDAIFTGFCTGANLARYYASGDIYLHASTTETFGKVVLEAMASGLALGAFHYAADREFVRPGRSGLTCTLGDEAAFLAQARRLADDDVLRRELGATARADALHWSWDAVIDGFLRDLGASGAEHRPIGSGSAIHPVTFVP